MRGIRKPPDLSRPVPRFRGRLLENAYSEKDDVGRPSTRRAFSVRDGGRDRTRRQSARRRRDAMSAITPAARGRNDVV